MTKYGKALQQSEPGTSKSTMDQYLGKQPDHMRTAASTSSTDSTCVKTTKTLAAHPPHSGPSLPKTTVAKGQSTIPLGKQTHTLGSPESDNKHLDVGELTETIHTPQINAPTNADIACMIASLPTREDLAAVEARLHATLNGDVAEIRQEMSILTTQQTEQTQQHQALEQRVRSLETQCKEIRDRADNQSLLKDDLENRSRRNNIKIHGIPEATTDANFRETVLAVFNNYLERPSTASIELDRVHRVGPRHPDRDMPRDVLCRIHFYHQKEKILQTAWRKGKLNFDGAEIHLLPDLSRRTLYMRRLLKPLLDRITRTGASYTWGFPFQLLIRKRNNARLSSPDQMPMAFEFLETQPILPPNWLSEIPAQVDSRSMPYRRGST